VELRRKKKKLLKNTVARARVRGNQRESVGKRTAHPTRSNTKRLDSTALLEIEDHAAGPAPGLRVQHWAKRPTLCANRNGGTSQIVQCNGLEDPKQEKRVQAKTRSS